MEQEKLYPRFARDSTRESCTGYRLWNKGVRSWLGAGHTLSRLCLFSSDSGVALPIDSLMDTWKVEKCRLQQSYNTTPDVVVKSIQPKVRSEKALIDAKRDLECEAVRGMIQPHSRAGIGFGQWTKPWERMSEKEKKEAVIGIVKRNIDSKQILSMNHQT